jgi:hypothetical protein
LKIHPRRLPSSGLRLYANYAQLETDGGGSRSYLGKARAARDGVLTGVRGFHSMQDRLKPLTILELKVHLVGGTESSRL